ncbi:unnamed protein product [Lactuca saligna]|uniref:Uncharacterized protein n=1 Tax=Lactuca saligna TaxID=75948 RepID=A0AA35ZW97_LACSI|nr:unnamed protein product [Lactuca saligna]
MPPKFSYNLATDWALVEIDLYNTELRSSNRELSLNTRTIVVERWRPKGFTGLAGGIHRSDGEGRSSSPVFDAQKRRSSGTAVVSVGVARGCSSSLSTVCFVSGREGRTGGTKSWFCASVVHTHKEATTGCAKTQGRKETQMSSGLQIHEGRRTDECFNKEMFTKEGSLTGDNEEKRKSAAMPKEKIGDSSGVWCLSYYCKKSSNYPAVFECCLIIHII